jgi:threonine/homoserine/homoserine lactone efflux protein
MIGKPQWFRRRKYTGWGFTPVTWEGWVYVFISILPLVLLTGFGPVNQTRMILIVIWALIVGFDFVDIIIHLPKDERDMIHEAIAERNALWVMIAVLAIGVGYQTASSAVAGAVKVDPIIIIAIIAGLVAKAISNIYLDSKN